MSIPLTSPRPSHETVRVLVVDDHPVVRNGISAMLREAPGMEVVGTSGRGDSALRLVGSLRPDVLLLDLSLPDQSGINVAQRVRAEWPEVAVLVLTGYSVDNNSPVLTRLGVRGVLHKSTPSEHLVEAIRAAAEGRSVPGATRGGDELLMPDPLTTRELEVLALVAAGMRNAEIANELHVSVNTVEFHMRNLLGKLGARSRTQAIARARSMGYSLPEEASLE